MFSSRRKRFGILVATGLAGLLTGLTLAVFEGSQPVESLARGFKIEKEVQVSLNPVAAFDAFTGDITAWWDHHFSEKPARIMIEPKPGGHFLELFDDAGNGVSHGMITWSERGKKLVIRGWLGPFHSTTGTLVHTFSFVPRDSGTQIRASIAMLGEFDAKTAEAVERVWDHFLLERFKPHAEKLAKPKQD